MKKLFILLFALLISQTGFGQEFLKGPKAKNTRITKFQNSDFSFVFNSNPETPKGPQAKNYKVWNSEGSKLRIRTRTEINNPKGLKAKNRKVWESEKGIIDSKAAYELPKSMKRQKKWWH